MSPLVVRVRGLSFRYGDRPVLAGADLDVAGGSRLAVLGANGSGKTTLLRCLSGSLAPTGGTVTLDDTPVRYDRAGLRAHRRIVQLVLQDPDDQLFSADVWRDVSFGPVNLGLEEPQVRERVGEALTLLGIGDLAGRPVHRLSHGQRKRVAIAGAVAMRPRLLLLDEPTSALDPAGVAELLTAIARLEANHTTVVIATHDVDLALRWADAAAVVVDGRLEQGPPAGVLGDRALVTRARLRLPWVLDVADRLGLAADAAPRDVETLAAALRARPVAAATIPHAASVAGPGGACEADETSECRPWAPAPPGRPGATTREALMTDEPVSCETAAGIEVLATRGPSRVSLTPAAADLLRRLVARHGPVMFHQSGGCCDGSAPMCYPDGDFLTGDADVHLGDLHVEGLKPIPVWISRAQFRAWSHTHLTIDAVPGRGAGFSLESPEGLRFLTRSRLLTPDELATFAEAK